MNLFRWGRPTTSPVLAATATAVPPGGAARAARCAGWAVATLLAACSGRDGTPAAPPLLAGFPAATAIAATPAVPTTAEPYAALARGRVDAPGGLLRVSAPLAARVERWAVNDGDEVKAGQLLVTLDGREARAELALARAELAHGQAQLAALGARLPALRSRALRLRQAFEADAGSGQAADDAQEAVVEAEQQQAVQRAALGTMRQRIAKAGQDVAAASVRAPAAGQVLRRLRQAGEHVEAQGALLQLLPGGARVVRADLNESLVGRVTPGMRAEVVPASQDGPPQTAHVLRVGAVFGPLRAPDPAAGEDASDMQAVECLLQLDNPLSGQELRVGQRVLVRFLR